MPDPLFKTISSSQVPDLLNISPWGTRLTLHHQFARREWEDRKPTIRMRLGKKFEEETLELTAEALALEVIPNTEQAYIRHPTAPIGCTEDATVLCPTRGKGTVEAKAVDKYEWMRSWTETTAPKMYETQLQHEMAAKGDAWGVIACLIYNEGTDGRLVLYERRPILSAQERIIAEATKFFDDLAAGREPPAFGLPIELGLANELYPVVDRAAIAEDYDNIEMAELVRLYNWTAQQAKGYTRAEAEMKPKILHYLGENGGANLAGGVVVRVKKPIMSGQVVMLPAETRKGLKKVEEFLLTFDSAGDRALAAHVRDALEWAHIVKQPGVQNRLAIIDGEENIAPDDDKATILEAV